MRRINITSMRRGGDMCLLVYHPVIFLSVFAK